MLFRHVIVNGKVPKDQSADSAEGEGGAGDAGGEEQLADHKQQVEGHYGWPSPESVGQVSSEEGKDDVG